MSLAGSTLQGSPYSTFATFVLPDQTVSFEEAMKDDWQHKCMDFFATQFMARDADRARMYDNYRLLNGQYAGTKNTTGLERMFENTKMGESPAEIIHYPICNLPLKTIWGEEIKRPLNFFVKAEDQDNISQHIANSTEMLFNFTTQEIQKKMQMKMQAAGIQEEGQEEYLKNSIENNMTLESIQEYAKYSYTTVAERCGNAILKKLIKSQNLVKKFRDGWKDATVVAREFYWTGVINGEVVCECVNPTNLVFEKSYDIDFIDEGSWAVRGEYMTPQQIIGRFPTLKVDDAKKLLNYNTGMYTAINEEKSGQIYTNNDHLVAGNYPLDSDDYENLRYPLSGDEVVFGMDGTSAVIKGNKHYLVIHSEWMKQRKIGIFTYLDEESGSWVNEIVDGSFKLSKEDKLAGSLINYLFINEPWTGVRIGADIYLDIKPKEDIFINPNKLSKRRLGYTGLVYNRRNATPISFLDEAKPFQQMFNIVMSQINKTINSDLGNILLMDMRQIPTSEGFNLDSWYTWLKESKILFLDSQKSGGFNQFTIAQSSILAAIQAHLSLANFLENQIFQIMGVSPQRMGTPTANSSNTTATENNNAIVQSYSQTEDYFFQHNLVKERVLQNLIEDAKMAYSNSDEYLSYFLDDMSISFLQLSKEFTFSDLCVYVTNSGKDIKDLEALKSLAQPAVQNGASLYDVATIITGESMHEIKDKLKAIKKANDAQQKAMSDLEQQKNDNIMKSTQMQIEEAKNARIAEQEWQSDENALDREKDIYVAELKVEANAAISMGTSDVNDNNIPDHYEIGKLAIENLKLSQNERKFSGDLQIKNKQREDKLKLEKDKIALQKEKLKTDIKQSRADIAVEKMKDSTERMKIKKMSNKTKK